MRILTPITTLAWLTILVFSVCNNKTNSIAAQEGLDQDLVLFLDTIWRAEQGSLELCHSLMREFGDESVEFQMQEKVFHINHVINEKKITGLLDSQGWPGVDMIGEQGSLTICNVIQHSSNEIRLKYLPMMKDAVKANKLQPRWLARAEDRIATVTGGLQIYGGQMKFYPETKSFNVWPVYDPANIDKRRADIGLGPIAEYLKERFDFVWNLEEQLERTAAFENSELGWNMSPTDVVNKRMYHYNSHNFEEFIKLYADDVKVYTYPDELLGTGKENIASIFKPKFDEKSIKVTIISQVNNGNHVINHEIVTEDGAHKKYISIYEIEDNLIQSVRFVRDN